MSVRKTKQGLEKSQIVVSCLLWGMKKWALSYYSPQQIIACLKTITAWRCYNVFFYHVVRLRQEKIQLRRKKIHLFLNEYSCYGYFYFWVFVHILPGSFLVFGFLNCFRFLMQIIIIWNIRILFQLCFYKVCESGKVFKKKIFYIFKAGYVVLCRLV